MDGNAARHDEGNKRAARPPLKRAERTRSPVAVALSEALETARMRVDEFDFDLPESRIALKPASPRDAARLLQVGSDAFGDLTIADLPRLLKRGDLLVLNDTKVIPAQLSGRRTAR